MSAPPKLVAVPVKAVRKLAHPVSLAAIKADPKFAKWELVTQARLSVMPVPDQLWERIEAMAAAAAKPAANEEAVVKKASKQKKS